MAEGDVIPSRGEGKTTFPIFRNGRYKNPWSTSSVLSYTKAFKVLFKTRDESAIPKTKTELHETLPVLKPDLKEFENFPESGIRHMWIGHASSLVQFDGITFLTDPVFSERCSPTQRFGTKRYRPIPCTVEELPQVDCVLISHNHYDHLDYNSVKALNARFGDSLQWYVPMGVKCWMVKSGCTNVEELTWWQEHLHSRESGITFISTPCQHWCKRTLFDNNKALWCSWCVVGPRHKFYFAGDTGYCEAFKEIGQKYGPFNLATIPIGAYSPRYIMAPHHVNPKEAVDVHNDIRSQQSVGIHWGTFNLTYEPYMEPKQKIEEELVNREMSPTSFVTVPHGDVRIFGGSEGSSQ